MIRKPVPSAQAHSGVALFILTLTILIALVALAPLNGAGQPSGQSTHPGSRSQAKGPVSGVSLPSSPLFLPAVTYGSGQFPWSVAVADLNGDGKPDLIVANYCSPCYHGSVSVLLGKGDGTFQSAVAYDSGGEQTVSLAVADVNRDGKPDLIVAYSGLSMVGLLLGNGDGTFQPAVTYNSGGSGAGSVAVADVNGDGKPDLLVANHCDMLGCPGSLGVLLGNGDGTFQAVVTYGSGGNYTHSVVVADVNGDGKPDLLVGSLCVVYPYNCDDLVGVLLGNGDGTFQPAVTYNSGDQYESAVAVADVNGDGKPDLLTANLISHSVGVLLNKGDGTFQTVMTYELGGIYALSVAVSDVNGDGEPDLVVAQDYEPAHHGFLGVLLGNGNATFQPALEYSSGGEPPPLSVGVADLNGDGKPDVIVANPASNDVGVLINNTGVHSPTSTSLTSGLNPSFYGQKVTWAAAVTASGSVTPTGKVQFRWSIYSIGSATLDSSGIATLTRSNLNAGTFPLTAVYGGDADNLGSTSAVLNQVVLQTTSKATLTSSPNPSTEGQAVTFTAKISSPTVIPMGPVTFTSGKTVLGTAQLSGGKAKLAISSLPVGSTKVTVTYYGNSNIAKSSASVIQTVQ